MHFRGFVVYVEVFSLAFFGAFHIALFGVFEVFSLVLSFFILCVCFFFVFFGGRFWCFRWCFEVFFVG